MLRPINIKDFLIERNSFFDLRYELKNDSYRSNAGQQTTFNSVTYPGNVTNTEHISANNNVNNPLIPQHNMVYPYGLNYNYTKQITQPGLYENEIVELRGPDEPITTNPKFHYIFYKVFLKASVTYKFDGVLKPNDGTISYMNSNSNPIHEIDWNGSFGERGVTFHVTKKVVIGNIVFYNTAVINTDYEIIVDQSNKKSIRFLLPGEYNVTVEAQGYTSNNNPYPNSSRSANFLNRTNSEEARKVTTNVATRNMTIIVFEENIVEPEPSVEDNINYPKVSPIINVVNPNYLISINPLTTYILVNVEITPSIDYNSASYIRITNGISTTLNLNNNQWLDKCKQDLQYDLLIINSKLNIHDVIENIDLDSSITYGFYPDDNYEVYYQAKIK